MSGGRRGGSVYVFHEAYLKWHFDPDDARRFGVPRSWGGPEGILEAPRESRGGPRFSAARPPPKVMPRYILSEVGRIRSRLLPEWPYINPGHGRVDGRALLVANARSSDDRLISISQSDSRLSPPDP